MTTNYVPYNTRTIIQTHNVEANKNYLVIIKTLLSGVDKNATGYMTGYVLTTSDAQHSNPSAVPYRSFSDISDTSGWYTEYVVIASSNVEGVINHVALHTCKLNGNPVANNKIHCLYSSMSSLKLF